MYIPFYNYLAFVFALSCLGNAFASNQAEEVFTQAYLTHAWNEPSSSSGPGSSLAQTGAIRRALPQVFAKYSIKRINDAACGDFHWLKTLDLTAYTYKGFDIVAALVASNNQKYAKPNIHFYKKDLINDVLPEADLIICRDVWVHFPISEIMKAIRSFKKSRTKYLLTTTFLRTNMANNDISFGVMEWRPLNLQLPPFNFPKPIEIIYEHCTEANGAFSDKCLALWRLDDIKV